MLKEYRLKIYLLVVGVIIVFFTWLFVLPRANQILTSRRTVEKETARLEKVKAKLEGLQGLDEYELTEQTESSLEAIPVKKDFFKSLNIVHRLAEENGLVVSEYKVSPGNLLEEGAAETSNGVGKLQFALKLDGPFEGIKRFLTTAEKTLPLLQVNEITVNIGEEEVSGLELSFENYFLPLPETLGKVDEAVPKLTSEEEKVITAIANFVKFPIAPVAPPASGRENPFTF